MLYKIILLTLLMASGVCAQGVPPEPPRELLNTAYNPATGITVLIGAGGDLQRELNIAHLGDDLVLSVDARFVGNFTIPVKSGTGTLIIRSSDLTSEGVRVTPADAGRMPKIISANNAPALATIGAASNYRFVGIEFGVSGSANGGIITLGSDNETSLAQLPSNIVIDRCYVHGSASANVRRGVALNSARSAIIDSYISDCHDANSEAQAVCGWNGSGPFKIVNNYLEGAGENVMFGGSDPKIANLTPSDIEFRHNTLSKPLSWKPNEPSYAGRLWNVKNIFELKNARRVLIDGNVFENIWVASQSGFAIQFTSRNQDGAASWCVVEDVSFTNNIIRHAAGAVNLLGIDNTQLSGQANRIAIKNNLFDDIGNARWGVNGRLFQILNGVLNLTIDHNTAFHTGNVITADLLPSPGLVFTNNLQAHNLYGVIGDSSSIGLASLNRYFPGFTFACNALVGGLARLYPPSNYFPTSQAAVGYTDLAGGNYTLLASSLLHNAGTDGKDVGADFAALALAQTGAPPVTPIIVLNLTATGISEYAVMLTCQTDRPAAVRVEFGYAGLTSQTLPRPPATSHAFTLDFLSSGMTLQYRVVATDSAGSVTVTPVQTVRTLPKTIQIIRD